MQDLTQFQSPDKTRSLIHFFMLIVVSFSLITFTGCGSDSPGNTTGPGGNSNNNNGGEVDEQGENEVWLEAASFNVSNLQISAGTTVTWTNKSNTPHTVTSGNRSDDDAGDLFDSGDMGAGQVFSYTFEEAGTYDYFCGYHSGMSATVTVTE